MMCPGWTDPSLENWVFKEINTSAGPDGSGALNAGACMLSAVTEHPVMLWHAHRLLPARPA